MHDHAAPPAPSAVSKPWHQRLPLYVKILIALVLGVIAGELLPAAAAAWFDIPAFLILRVLGAIAPPLILIAVVRALITANVRGRLAGRMFFLLALNTVVAILIGLLVANVIQPGKHAHMTGEHAAAPAVAQLHPLQQILDQIPSSLVGPLVDNNVIGVIFIALTAGLACRRLDEARQKKVLDALDIGFDLILIVLHWILTLVPLAVFCKVTYVVGTKGFAPFIALGWFIAAVLVGLLLQSIYYLARVRMASWVSPVRLIRGTRDALAMAFSTGSSTATMPVTYANLVERVGLREQSASLGALVGSNFNNDGTALYEAMAALFVAQMLGTNLTIAQQAMVVLTSVIASVGAAGIPEAGLVTMTLVFSAVHLPTEYIALLLPVDWFLDRCRTAINVMGDMNVSCILDGPVPHAPVKADPLLETVG